MAHQRPAKKARPGFGRRWTAIRARMLRRSDWTCAGCGHRDVTGASLQIDHITRQADGGSDELGNLQVLCTGCHKDKSAAERRR
jgi:5-methylcytosine-specific restriction protein A